MCDPLRQRSDYLERMNAFQDAVKTASVGCGADYRLVNTNDPMEIVLRDYLLYRRQRG